MKSAVTILEEAIKRRNQRHYPFLYIAIDLHGTILTPNRCTHFEISDGTDSPSEVPCWIGVKKSEPYPYAYETLKLISDNFPWIKLILWTSGKKKEAREFVDNLLKDEGIKFWNINDNPDFDGNLYADFSEKFCFDVLFDDKAGFDPKTDWSEIFIFLKNHVNKEASPTEL